MINEYKLCSICHVNGATRILIPAGSNDTAMVPLEVLINAETYKQFCC